jgi:hypothetical protein
MPTDRRRCQPDENEQNVRRLNDAVVVSQTTRGRPTEYRKRLNVVDKHKINV